MILLCNNAVINFVRHFIYLSQAEFPRQELHVSDTVVHSNPVITNPVKPSFPLIVNFEGSERVPFHC